MSSFNVYESIGKQVRLFTLAPAVLGSNVKGYFAGILDYASAAAFEDIQALHQRVYPYLPKDVPDNATMYPYCKIIDAKTSAVKIIGLPWIDQSNSIVITEILANVAITLSTVNDVDLLRRSLHSNGFENFQITLVD